MISLLVFVLLMYIGTEFLGAKPRSRSNEELRMGSELRSHTEQRDGYCLGKATSAKEQTCRLHNNSFKDFQEAVHFVLNRIKQQGKQKEGG